MVDELGALETEYAPLKNKFDRIDEIRKRLRAAYDKADSAQEYQLQGDRFFVAIGARAMAKSIDLARLAKAVGLTAFVRMASVSLKALNEEKVPPATVDSVISEAQTGSRPLKVFPKAKAGKL